MIEILTAAMIVTGVGQCVIDELEATPESGGVPPKMRICLLVPGNIAWDSCECGQFAQSIQSDYFSNRFPVDSSQEQVRSCIEPLAYQVTASLLRCAPGMTNGNPPQPPSCVKLLESALTLQADAFALRKAVACCLLTYQEQFIISDFRIGQATRVGPDGGCVGVELVYWFQLI